MDMEETFKMVSGYTQLVGEKVLNARFKSNLQTANRRVFRIQQDFESKGFFVIVNSNVNKGVDLLVFDKVNARLIEAVEITNYARADEYINDSRLCRYIESLNYYDKLPNVRKKLYVSFEDNVYNKKVTENSLKWLRQSNIEVIALGAQD